MRGLVLFVLLLDQVVHSLPPTVEMCGDYCNGNGKTIGGVMQWCRDTFASDAECMATCSTYEARDRRRIYAYDADGTWQCRMAHLDWMRFFNQARVRHCPHVSPSGGGVCVARFVAGPTPGSQVPSAEYVAYISVVRQLDDLLLRGNERGSSFIGGIMAYTFRRQENQARGYTDPYTEEEHTQTQARLGAGFCTGKTRYRTADGTCNSLDKPEEASVGTRFGRVYPFTFPQFTNKRTLQARMNEPPMWKVAEFMARYNNMGFQPSPTNFNIFGSAWMHFVHHDWGNHKLDSTCRDSSGKLNCNPNNREHCTEIRMNREGDTFCVENTMFEDSTDADYSINTETYWSDASQIYGSTAELQAKLRNGIYLQTRSGDTGEQFLGREANGNILTGFSKNWWVGLEILHTLFVREHNYVADQLQATYPAMTDEEVFQTSRLCVSALITKIHTMDFAPSVTDNAVCQVWGIADWYGLNSAVQLASLPEAAFEQAFGAPFDQIANTTMGGRGRGDQTPRGDARYPFYPSEDLVAAQRLHTLLPDYIKIRGETRKITDFFFGWNFNEFQADGLSMWLKEFGLQRAGAVQATNYPQSLMDMMMPDGRKINLAVFDIFRDRERGLPRYREFVRAINNAYESRIKDFSDISPSVEFNEAVKELYGGDLDKVDLAVGLMGEGLRIKGSILGDTAFRLFIVANQDHITFDRFYQDEYRPEVYTAWGLNYVESTSLKDVIGRHCPELQPFLDVTPNVFKTWTTPSPQTRRTQDPHFTKGCKDMGCSNNQTPCNGDREVTYNVNFNVHAMDHPETD